MRYVPFAFHRLAWTFALPRQPFLSSSFSKATPVCPKPIAGKTSRTYAHLTARSNERHVVLVSGGVESSVLLRQVSLSTNHNVTALFIDYGQRAAQQERQAVQRQCKESNVSDLVEIDLRSVGETFGQRSGRERRFVPIPHRNLVLVALATSLADVENAGVICIAVSKDDEGWYPSASGSFVRAFQCVVEGLDGNMRIEAPLIGLSKSEIVKVGVQIGVEFGSTWSCMVGRGSIHCGRCVQCRARKKAFVEAGVTEGGGFYAR